VLAAIKTIQEGIICPTINYQTPDPECDLDYVPNEARPQDVDLALVHAFGFGGHNVVVTVGKYYENGKNGTN
jgi:3-oxoacyl-(acyl-carrier-protein) synthase